MRQVKLTLITIVSILFILSSITDSVTFTLSDVGILMLDCNNDSKNYPKMTSKVIARRNIQGPGVEFDIQYFGNEPPHNSMYWCSSAEKGEGLLKNIDISKFDGFGLEFKILSINGSKAPDTAGPIIVGSLINRKTSSFAYRPMTIGLANEASKSAISITTTDADVIETIGFVSNIPSWWYNEQKPNPWDPQGSVITLLVKPLENTTVIPYQKDISENTKVPVFGSHDVENIPHRPVSRWTKALFPLLVFPICCVGFLFFIFWIWMLIDCLINEPSEGNDKIVWVLVIVFTHWIGALIYLFLQRPKRKAKYGR